MATIYKLGSTGEVVKRIQKVVGCYPDGVFGRLTQEAVKTWQREHSLTADGVVGPATMAKMGLSAVVQTVKPTGVVYSVENFVLKRSKRRITDIVVHCTATREGQDMTVEQIRAEHKKNGWADIGYHYVVYRDGQVKVGRDVDYSGAHVAGYNAHSIGIAYVGGVANLSGVPYSKLPAKDTRTEQQKASLLALLMDLRKLYPTARIRGHRDFSPDKNGDGVISADEWLKDCPSFDAVTEFRKV